MTNFQRGLIWAVASILTFLAIGFLLAGGF